MPLPTFDDVPLSGAEFDDVSTLLAEIENRGLADAADAGGQLREAIAEGTSDATADQNGSSGHDVSFGEDVMSDFDQ